MFKNVEVRVRILITSKSSRERGGGCHGGKAYHMTSLSCDQPIMFSMRSYTGEEAPGRRVGVCGALLGVELYSVFREFSVRF